MQPETNTKKIAARLKAEGWVGEHGGGHDIYRHPSKPGRIVLPRHTATSPGVARQIAKIAGWL